MAFFILRSSWRGNIIAVKASGRPRPAPATPMRYVNKLRYTMTLCRNRRLFTVGNLHKKQHACIVYNYSVPFLYKIRIKTLCFCPVFIPVPAVPAFSHPGISRKFLPALTSVLCQAAAALVTFRATHARLLEQKWKTPDYQPCRNQSTRFPRYLSIF